MNRNWIIFLSILVLSQACKKDPLLTASKPEVNSIISTQSPCYLTSLVEEWPFSSYGYRFEYDSSNKIIQSKIRGHFISSPVWTLTYSYDTLGRVVEELFRLDDCYQRGHTRRYSFTYDSRDLIVRIDTGGIYKVLLTYDLQERLIMYELYAGVLLDEKYVYEYNADGNVFKCKKYNYRNFDLDSTITVFEYDSLINPFAFMNVPISWHFFHWWPNFTDWPIFVGFEPFFNKYSKNNIISNYIIDYYKFGVRDTTSYNYTYTYNENRLPTSIECSDSFDFKANFEYRCN